MNEDNMFELRRKFYENELIEIKTRTGNNAVIYRKNKFSKKNEKNGLCYYRCTNKKCNAYIYIVDLKVIKGNNYHICLDEFEFISIFAYENIQNNALNSYLKPKEIIMNAINSLDIKEKSKITKISSLTIKINRMKKKNLISPSDNNNISEYLFNDIEGNKFIHHVSCKNEKDGCIIMMNENSKIHLQRAKIWLIDGTFKSCPPEFYQIFVIHTKILGKILPMAYILLKNKTKEQYIKMFSLVKNILNQINLENIIVDYERSIHEALKDIFPNTIIHGCFFHWCQNIIKNLKLNGLYKTYKSDRKFKQYTRLILSLPFSPIEKVESYFNILRNLVLLHYNDENIKHLLFFIEKNYISENSKTAWNKKIWNCFDRVLKNIPLTNNNIEVFNRSINRNLNNPIHH
ncbi:hypothetical protein DMUE_1492 [Dictyocoela muelleri]|nr:hypothetical protein DMUE_1492 [Dictyocoela muelleri]